jgi:hypothetical protein
VTAVQVGEEVEQVLGAAHRERRDHDVAAPLHDRLVECRHELVERLVEGLVQPVAVGRFDHEDVGLGDGRGIAHDRPARLPEIAREHEPAGVAAGRDARLDDRRAEDVAGVAEAAAHGRVRRNFRIVGDRLQLRETGLRLDHRVERRRGGFAPPAPALAPLRFLFLDVGGVEEHHFEQVGRRFRGVDRPAEAFRRQPRQQPRVVDVRVRDQHEVERARIEGEGLRVLRVGLPPALEHAAVDEKAQSRRLHEEARARHFAGGPEESELHGAAVAEASSASSVRSTRSRISASPMTYGGMK